MASINTLIRKGYLFAGVIMAANMFVVNEMKAMEDIQQEHEKDAKEGNDGSTFLKFLDMTSGFVLKWENLINFIGGAVISGFNNYFKWWDYNPGRYCNLRIGCLGLRSKRLLNGMLQFEGNFNLGRGFLWLLLGAYNFIKGFTVKEQQERMFYFTPLYVSTLVACCVGNHNFWAKTAHIVFFLVQGFVSIPLTLHIPKINLSISISLDSIIWGITGMILERKLLKNVPIKNAGEKGDEILIDKDKDKEEKNDNEDKEENNLINKESEENK